MGVAERSADAVELLGAVFDAYERMEIEIRTYVLVVLLPASALFGASLVLAIVLETILFVRILLPVLGGLFLAAAIAYPKLLIDRRRIEMENRFHLVVTHMTVLSTTNIDRMEVFRKLAAEEEYGELATEIRRIVELVDTWNQSLDDACRRRAKQVPSDSLADLFDRLAYTLGAGQPLEDFLLEEQHVMIENYSTIYEQSLENLDVLKDLYLSMVLSMTFALVFAVVLPILTGTNPTWTVSAVIAIYVFVQIGFFLVIRAIVPYDPVWFLPDGPWTTTKKRLVASTVGGAVLSLIVVVGMVGAVLAAPSLLDPVPQSLYLPLPTLPLLIPALVFRIEERGVIDRDEEFPSFIRALGASESAKQSTTSEVLSTLRQKDFGTLSPTIDDLYRRLNIRIDSRKAWRYFAGDANSYLIQKFSEMYLLGREMGGDPKQLGELISGNMNQINQLREQRRQVTVTLVGLLYGITAAASFAFFTGLEIAIIMSGFDLNVAEAGVDFAKLLHTDSYNVPLLRYLLFLVILFNAAVSSLTIRTADGGHYGNAYLHFVILTWVGSLTALATRTLISTLLEVGV